MALDDLDESRADILFLSRFLAWRGFGDLTTGTSQPQLTGSSLRILPVPLPPLAEQRRIAAILDEADAIRAKRRAQLACLDELPKALFREMFGDPVCAPGPRCAIHDIAQVVTGNTPSRKDSVNYGSDIEWVKSDNLGGFIATRATERLSPSGRQKARIAPSGSVLVTCIAGSPASIGKSSIVDRAVAFNQQINAIFPSDRLESAFIQTMLASAPELVRAKSTGGMKGLVSKSAFGSISIITPPLVKQKAFADKVVAVRTERDRVARALEADDELFSALQHRAFRGEL